MPEPRWPLTYNDTFPGDTVPRKVSDPAEIREIAQGCLDEVLDTYRDVTGREYTVEIVQIRLRDASSGMDAVPTGTETDPLAERFGGEDVNLS